MTTLYTEGDTTAQLADANAVMELLLAVYPGHPWAVRVAGGVIIIRYLNTFLSGNWGLVIKVKDVYHDAAVLKHDVIMAAGEWLERAGLARGRATEDEIVDIQGIPMKYKPGIVTADAIVIDDKPYERQSLRPQVLKAENG